MKSRLILPVAAAAIALVASSCTPWVEPNPPMPPGGDAAARNMPADPNADEAARMQQEKRDRLKRKQERLERQREQGNEGDAQGDGQGEAPKHNDSAAGGNDEGGEKPHVKEKPASYPTATKVPGKPGMVFSPFNNQMVDVQGIPSGKLVRDPTYPKADNKIFKVP